MEFKYGDDHERYTREKHRKDSGIYGNWTSSTENIRDIHSAAHLHNLTSNWDWSGNRMNHINNESVVSPCRCGEERITLRRENFELKHMNIEKAKTIDQLQLENRLKDARIRELVMNLEKSIQGESYQQDDKGSDQNYAEATIASNKDESVDDTSHATQVTRKEKTSNARVKQDDRTPITTTTTTEGIHGMRSNNIMIFGCIENTDNTEEPKDQRKNDEYIVDEVLTGIGYTTQPKNVERIGNRRERKYRPIKVTLASSSDRDFILRNMFKYKDSANFAEAFGRLSVREDLTTEERQRRRSLIEKATELNNSNSDQHVVIRGSTKTGWRLVVKKKGNQAPIY